MQYYHAIYIVFTYLLHLQAMKITFLKLFLICTFKSLNLAEFLCKVYGVFFFFPQLVADSQDSCKLVSRFQILEMGADHQDTFRLLGRLQKFNKLSDCQESCKLFKIFTVSDCLDYGLSGKRHGIKSRIQETLKPLMCVLKNPAFGRH